jgi:hypothetical protein
MAHQAPCRAALLALWVHGHQGEVQNKVEQCWVAGGQPLEAPQHVGEQSLRLTGDVRCRHGRRVASQSRWAQLSHSLFFGLLGICQSVVVQDDRLNPPQCLDALDALGLPDGINKNRKTAANGGLKRYDSQW